jgi:hypothetical protein
MKEETLEEAFSNYVNEKYHSPIQGSIPDLESAKFGVKWAQEKMYSENNMIEFSEWVSENYPNQTNYLRNLRRFHEGKHVPPEKLIYYYTTKQLLEKFKNK